MFHLSKLAVLGLFSLGLAGCQATNPPSPDAKTGTPSTQAVACSKCQTVWVKEAVTNQKGRVAGYSTKQQMACPDCRNMVENFFETGHLEHGCKACNGTMETCDMH